MGFRVEGLGFRGFTVWGLGLRIFRLRALELSGFTVSGLWSLGVFWGNAAAQGLSSVDGVSGF